jgi:5-methylcytosine-specific restriction endonuclease McrBC regulatory subunit McrC
MKKTMHKVTIKEWETSEGLPEPFTERDWKTFDENLKKYFDVWERGGKTFISAKQYIGKICFGNYEITIRPKIKINDLAVLFFYAFNLDNLSRFDNLNIFCKDFADLLVCALLQEVQSIQRRGVFQQYIRQRKEISMLRGGIDIPKVVNRVGLTSATLPSKFFQRSFDNALNQTLLAGLKKSISVATLSILKSKIQQIVSEFSVFVTDSHLSKHLLEKANRSLNRLNSYYEPSLRLIHLLYDGITGFDGDKQRDANVNGFLFDMNKLFEKVLERFFKENLSGYNVQGQEHFLEPYNKKCNIIPDLTIRSQNGDIVMFADAKYQDITEKGVGSKPFYQLSIYAAVNPNKQAVMLYPVSGENCPAKKEYQLQTIDKKYLATVIVQSVSIKCLINIINSKKKDETFARELLGLL